MLIPNNIFEYIYHIGCAINLHRHKFRIDTGGQNLSKERQTVFFTAVNPVYKEHKDPYEIDFNAPRLASENVEKTPRHSVLGRYTTCSIERIQVLSNTIEHYHSSRNTPSLLYPESCSDGIWINHLRESICVTSTSSKDFL